MDKRRLEAFVRLVEKGGFRHAAGELNITQPALSQLISRIEKEVGIQLIDRSTRPVATTQAGKEFYFRSRKVLDAMGEIDRLVEDAHTAKFGRVRIGVVPAMLFAAPTRSVRHFQQEYPDVEIEIESVKTIDLVESVRRGGIDVAILLTAPRIEGISSVELYSEEYVVCLPEGHSLTQKKEVHFSDLENERIIHGTRSATPTGFDAILVACAEAGFSPQFLSVPGSYLDQAGLVSAGMGVSFAPASFQHLRPNNVEYRPLINPKVGTPVSISWFEDRIDQAGKMFVQHCINQCTSP